MFQSVDLLQLLNMMAQISVCRVGVLLNKKECEKKMGYIYSICGLVINPVWIPLLDLLRHNV